MGLERLSHGVMDKIFTIKGRRVISLQRCGFIKILIRRHQIKSPYGRLILLQGVIIKKQAGDMDTRRSLASHLANLAASSRLDLLDVLELLLAFGLRELEHCG